MQVRNTQLFPFSAVGELTGQLGTSNRGLECTGTLIGPKHVVGLPVHDTFSSRLGLIRWCTIQPANPAGKVCACLPVVMLRPFLGSPTKPKALHATCLDGSWECRLMGVLRLMVHSTALAVMSVPYSMQVTAAHCVYDINDSRQYVANLNFAPGEADENTLPYGSVQWASVRVLSQFTSQVRRCRAGCMSTCRALGGVQHAIGVYCTGHPPQYCC